MQIRYLRHGVTTAVLAITVLMPTTVLAQFGGLGGLGGGGMPWEGPLEALVDSISGPVARALGFFALFGVGIAIAFSDGGSAMRRFLWVVLGLAIAFNAASWGLEFLGFSG